MTNSARKQEINWKSTLTSFKKGQLFVNNEPYGKKVSTPSTHSLLHMETMDISNIKNISVVGGYSYTEQGSRFIGYAAKAADLQEVRQAYIHLKGYIQMLIMSRWLIGLQDLTKLQMKTM